MLTEKLDAFIDRCGVWIADHSYAIIVAFIGLGIAAMPLVAR
jgi:hypothetical protein